MKTNGLMVLLAGSSLAVAPGLFLNRASSPKMLAAGVGLYMLLARPHFRPFPEAWAKVFTFLLVCAVSALFSVDRWIAVAGSPKAPYFGLVSLGMVAVAYFASTDMDDRPLPVLEHLGVALALFGMLQVAWGTSFTGMPMPVGRAVGMRGSPVMFAASLVPCFLASWHLIRRSLFVPTLRRALPLIVIFLGMIAAQAKGAILATLVGVWVYETTGRLRVLGVVLAVELLWWFMLAVPIANNLERLELLRISWAAFWKRPIFGWGPDNFIWAFLKHKTPEYVAIVKSAKQGQASAHQDLAQVAVTLGLVGLVAYLRLLWSLAKASLASPLAIAVLAALWFQAQVNPVPTDVLIIGAVILGSNHASEDWGEIPCWVGPVILCAVVFLATLDLAPAARAVFR